MKEMYYILGLAGWIWLALVAPLMIGFSIVRWRRRKATRPGGFEVSLTDERPAQGADSQSRRIETSDEEQP